MVADFHMPREVAIVGCDKMVSHHAVVGHMGISHQIAMAAENSLAGGLRPAVERATFPDRGVVADPQKRFLASELEILWLRAQGGSLKNPAAAPDPRPCGHSNIGADLAVITNHNILFDN